MKKLNKYTLSVLITLVISATSVSTAFAAYAPVQALSDLNEWITKSSSIDYVNGQLQEGLKLAREQIGDNATLLEFNFIFQRDGANSCDFTFGSATNDENDVSALCTFDDQPKTELIPDANPRRGLIYKINLKMRDLIPAMLNDEDLLETLNDLFADDAEIHLSFNLQKGSRNHTFWTARLTDTKNEVTYLVRTSAQNEGAPIFSIYAQP